MALTYRQKKAIRRRERIDMRKLKDEDWKWRDPDHLRAREKRFVRIFVPRAILGFGLAQEQGKIRPDKLAFTVLAAFCLPLAGWRVKARTQRQDKNGVPATRPSRSAYLKADELLQLPRMQRALDAEFAKHGLPMEDVAQIISDIAHGKVLGTRKVWKNDEAIELEIVPGARDRLAAVDMRVRMTTGYAPTTARNLNVNARADQLFEREQFEETPDVNLEPEP